MDAQARIAEKAARQHGLITRAQARVLGLSDQGCDRMLASRRWLSLQAGVYCPAGSPPSREQEIHAACLASGGVASHRAAAALLGFKKVEYHAEVTVPQGRRVQLKGVVIHRTRQLDWVDKAWVDGIPATSVARTVIDLPSVLDRASMEAVVDWVLATRRVRLAYLKGRLLALGIGGRKGARMLADILAAREGQPGYADSEPQRELDRLLAAHGLPPGVSEHPVRLAGGRVRHVDKGWPDHDVVLQIDSYQHHSTLRDHTSDITRDNEVALQGLRVLRVTPEQISREPEAVAALVRGALGIASEGLTG